MTKKLFLVRVPLWRGFAVHLQIIRSLEIHVIVYDVMIQTARHAVLAGFPGTVAMLRLLFLCSELLPLFFVQVT